MQFIRILAIGLFFFLTAATAGQPDQPAPTDAGWQFTVAPYGWLSGQYGDMTIQGNTAHVDIKPYDLFDMIKYLDFVGELHIEATKGRWGILLDPTYLKVSPNSTVGPITVTTTVKFFLLDFGVFYTFMQHDFDSNSWIKLQALLGGRDLYLNNRIMLTPVAFGGSINWINPMFGARLIWHASRKFDLWLRFDASVGAHSNSWNAALMTAYSFNDHFALSLGYRYLYFYGRSSAGAAIFSSDIAYYGPVMGLIFKF